MTPLAASPAAPVAPVAPTVGPRRTFAIARYAFRGVATVHALLVMSQAFSIGQYLNGSYPMIRLHATLAGICVLAAMGLAVTALGYVVAGGRWWVTSGLLFFFAEGIQTGMGYAWSLAIHVPLGVGIVGGAVALAIWSWSHAAARPRSRRVQTTQDQPS